MIKVGYEDDTGNIWTVRLQSLGLGSWNPALNFQVGSPYATAWKSRKSMRLRCRRAIITRDEPGTGRQVRAVAPIFQKSVFEALVIGSFVVWQGYIWQIVGTEGESRR